jgi:hypothetical protein
MRKYVIGDEPIAGYRLVDRGDGKGPIGQGSFGVCWKAMGPGGVAHAMKIVQNLDGRFAIREWESLQDVMNLKHPNLCQIAGVWILDADGKIIDESAIRHVTAIARNESGVKTPTFAPTADPNTHQVQTCPAPMTLDAEASLAALQATMAPAVGSEEPSVDINQLTTPINAGTPTTSATGSAGKAPRPIEGVTLPELMLVSIMTLGTRTMKDLLSDLDENEVIPRDELLRYFGQAAAGLQYLNSEGVQHCDVKPDNLLIVNGGVQICDYGSALKMMFHKEEKENKGTSTAYAPPELIKRRVTLHKSIDVYSLAMAYIELRIKGFPWPNERISLQNLLALKEKEDFDLSKVDRLTEPHQFESAVLRKALKADSKERFSSVQEFYDALEFVPDQEARAERERKEAKTRFWVGSLIAVLVLAAVGGVAWAALANYWTPKRSDFAAMLELVGQKGEVFDGYEKELQNMFQSGVADEDHRALDIDEFVKKVGGSAVSDKRLLYLAAWTKLTEPTPSAEDDRVTCRAIEAALSPSSPFAEMPEALAAFGERLDKLLAKRESEVHAPELTRTESLAASLQRLAVTIADRWESSDATAQAARLAKVNLANTVLDVRTNKIKPEELKALPTSLEKWRKDLESIGKTTSGSDASSDGASETIPDYGKQCDLLTAWATVKVDPSAFLATVGSAGDMNESSLKAATAEPAFERNLKLRKDIEASVESFAASYPGAKSELMGKAREVLGGEAISRIALGRAEQRLSKGEWSEADSELATIESSTMKEPQLGRRELLRVWLDYGSGKKAEFAADDLNSAMKARKDWPNEFKAAVSAISTWATDPNQSEVSRSSQLLDALSDKDAGNQAAANDPLFDCQRLATEFRLNRLLKDSDPASKFSILAKDAAFLFKNPSITAETRQLAAAFLCDISGISSPESFVTKDQADEAANFLRGVDARGPYLDYALALHDLGSSDDARIKQAIDILTMRDPKASANLADAQEFLPLRRLAVSKALLSKAFIAAPLDKVNLLGGATKTIPDSLRLAENWYLTPTQAASEEVTNLGRQIAALGLLLGGPDSLGAIVKPTFDGTSKTIDELCNDTAWAPYKTSLHLAIARLLASSSAQSPSTDAELGNALLHYQVVIDATYRRESGCIGLKTNSAAISDVVAYLQIIGPAATAASKVNADAEALEAALAKVYEAKVFVLDRAFLQSREIGLTERSANNELIAATELALKYLPMDAVELRSRVLEARFWSQEGIESDKEKILAELQPFVSANDSANVSLPELLTLSGYVSLVRSESQPSQSDAKAMLELAEQKFTKALEQLEAFKGGVDRHPSVLKNRAAIVRLYLGQTKVQLAFRLGADKLAKLQEAEKLFADVLEVRDRQEALRYRQRYVGYQFQGNALEDIAEYCQADLSRDETTAYYAKAVESFNTAWNNAFDADTDQPGLKIAELRCRWRQYQSSGNTNPADLDDLSTLYRQEIVKTAKLILGRNDFDSTADIDVLPVVPSPYSIQAIDALLFLGQIEKKRGAPDKAEQAWSLGAKIAKANRSNDWSEFQGSLIDLAQEGNGVSGNVDSFIEEMRSAWTQPEGDPQDQVEKLCKDNSTRRIFVMYLELKRIEGKPPTETPDQKSKRERASFEKALIQLDDNLASASAHQSFARRDLRITLLSFGVQRLLRRAEPPGEVAQLALKRIGEIAATSGETGGVPSDWNDIHLALKEYSKLPILVDKNVDKSPPNGPALKAVVDPLSKIDRWKLQYWVTCLKNVGDYGIKCKQVPDSSQTTEALVSILKQINEMRSDNDVWERLINSLEVQK